MNTEKERMEQKLKVNIDKTKRYLSEGLGSSTIAEKLGVHECSVRLWINHICKVEKG